MMRTLLHGQNKEITRATLVHVPPFRNASLRDCLRRQFGCSQLSSHAACGADSGEESCPLET